MDLSHLAPKVREIALRDAEDRIAYCDMPVWIKTNSTKSFIGAIERMIELQRIGSRSCVGLVGVSGIGKTTLIERAEAQMNTPDATPIIRIDLSNCGRHLDLQELFLSHLGFTEKVKSLSNADGIKRVRARLDQMKTSVCILDEANALAGVRAMFIQPNYTYLRAMANRDIGVSVIVAGTEELKTHLSIDPQCRSRFAVWELPCWKADSAEFSQFLKAFVRFMPLRKPSILDTDAVQKKLVDDCKGSTREIVKVLIAAAKLAIQTGEEFIDEALIGLCQDFLLPTFGED